MNTIRYVSGSSSSFRKMSYDWLTKQWDPDTKNNRTATHRQPIRKEASRAATYRPFIVSCLIVEKNGARFDKRSTWKLMIDVDGFHVHDYTDMQ